MWTQNFNPLGNIGLSALVAAIPIFYLFWALAVKRMKGHVAGLSTVLLALLVAIIVYQMPVSLAVTGTINGMLFGLFPIGWIVIAAVFLYNLTVKTGQFEIIKDSIATITEDRRLQALLIAFSFGAFLEGAAGFGAPVAIAAGMLVGLGFNPLYAAGLSLIANTAPVAFGAIGIPIITAGSVSGIDAFTISQMVGRQLPFLSLFVPFWIVFIMSGWKGAKEVMPAILVNGGTFALTQYLVSNHMGPMLPDILSAVVSMVATVLLLKVWQPKNIWRFADERDAARTEPTRHKGGKILRAWSPFIVLTLMVADWGIKGVKDLVDLVSVKVPFPIINQAFQAPGGKPIGVAFNFNWLQAAGTAILIAALISMFLLRISLSDGWRTFKESLHMLRYPLVTIMSVLGFAFIANYSGMSNSLGLALSATGVAFAFLSPFIGWLGVFITGSDTSSNALFATLQKVTAGNLGLDPVLTVAANSSGGVTGKMISPQSIAVAAAATGLVGREGELIRFTIKHSIFFTAIVGVITFLQAHYLQWMIPKISTTASASTAVDANPYVTLGITLVIVILLAIVTRNRMYKNHTPSNYSKDVHI